MTFPLWQTHLRDLNNHAINIFQDSSVDVGICEDQIWVVYKDPSGADLATTRVRDQMLFVSPYSAMDIELRTCSRFDPRTWDSIIERWYLEAVYQPSGIHFSIQTCTYTFQSNNR